MTYQINQQVVGGTKGKEKR